MRKAFFTIFLCQIILLGSCQSKVSTSNEIVIPMDISTHRPIVEVMINGKGPYKFIFDTGSTTNVIDESLHQEFAFKVVGEDPLMTPDSDNQLVSQRVGVPNVSFPTTNISKDTEMNVIALRAMLPVDGVIGGFLLEDYLVAMDYPNSKLILSQGHLNKSDKDVISFIQNPRVLNVNVDIAGNTMEAHIDTGNPGAFTLPYSMKDKLTFKEEPKKGDAIRTPVASFNRWDAELIGSIKIGSIVYENPKVILAEGFKFVNLGYDVVKNLRTTIDRKNGLIKFEEVTSTLLETKSTKIVTTPTSPYAGNYEGDRKVWVDESGELQYQRAPSPMALKLTLIEENHYGMKVPAGVRTPNGIPNIHFIKNDNVVTGIELVYNDGRKEGPFNKIN